MQSTIKTFLLCLLALYTVPAFSQKETYDLVSYTIPEKWQKQEHANGVQLSAGDEKKGTYSAIVILHSSPTNVTVQADFTTDWEMLIRKAVTVSSEPVMQTLVEKDGWNILTGTAECKDGATRGMAMLMKGGYTSRIQWAFTAFDINHDGIISLPELTHLIRLVMGYTEVDAASLAMTLMQRYDVDRSGGLDAREFTAAIGSDFKLSSAFWNSVA
ncbi:MAG: EF-hand domain-containing protein [Sphingobacteriales bacterium]|nr:MAG: EF-hand domain-containing protein [Sphingobacteriales bacterium]